MSLIFMSQVSGILKPFAWIMGVILDWIYRLVAWMGIPNIALCIVLFTIVIKMLTLPLTIKQQKSAKVSAKMQPEIQAIQEKYKNADRSNREVMMRMTEEQQAVYRKYGTSPAGGCLPLILLFLIIFALYNVIYAIPAYVKPVKELYKPVSTAFMDEIKDSEYKDIYTDALKEFLTYEGGSIRNKKTRKASKWNENQVIDAMSVFNTQAWDDFLNAKVIMKKDKSGNETDEEDDKCKNWNTLVKSDEFKAAVAGKGEDRDEILRVNSLFRKYSILDAPGWKLTPMLLIPILAAVLQYIQSMRSLAMQKDGNKNDKKDQGGFTGSMEGMMKVMPIMSGIFCVFFPIGVGIYWIMNSAVSIVQQELINKHFEKLSIDDIVAANEAKQKEKMRKMGIVSTGNEVSNVTKVSTKNISTITTDSKNSKATANDKGPSQKISDKKMEEIRKNAAEGKSNISAIANLYRNDDEEE